MKSKRFMQLAILFVLLALSTSLRAQDRFIKKKYIFILDITKSMCGYGGSPDIMDEVKRELSEAIDNIKDPNSEIVLSTFQDKVVHTWTVDDASSDSKKTLLKNLNGIKCKDLAITRTNLYAAWKEVKRHLDRNKMNVTFVLTDGEHNSKLNSKSQMLNEIKAWDKIGENNYAFLVQMTPESFDKASVDAVETTKRVQIIRGIEFIVLQLKNASPIVNTEESLEFTLDVFKEHWKDKFNDLKLRLVLKDTNFKLSKTEFKIIELPAKVELLYSQPLDLLKKSLPIESELEIKVKLDDMYPQIKLIDDKIRVKVNNKKEKVLRIWMKE